MSSLQSAHKGYQYQDLSTAIALVHMMVANAGTVTADRKDGSSDKFDDITQRMPGARVSRQLKWTDNERRTLTVDDFTATKSSVRIDTLVAAHSQMQREPETEVRLAVRWGHPVEQDLLNYLEEVSSIPPTFEGFATKRFRLRAENIWPNGSTPAWTVLNSVSRAQFVAFVQDFVVETGLPQCSRDLSEPGDLERHLLDLLRNKVGIGQFPNQNRLLEDVAARLIQVAATARADCATLSPDQVSTSISLQRDFGHVVQDFPFRSIQYVERAVLRECLRDAIHAHRRVALIGPPGSGKSWELTNLASILRDQGYLVARHYCYISPDDDHVEFRITADVMYGNIIQELLAADPSLIAAKESRFAATATELQVLLQFASQSGYAGKVVVVVDGLDHIARVAQEATRVLRAQMTIIEDLASLEWPEGTCLVLGSQPGAHLLALFESDADIQRLEMPPLAVDELGAISESLGLGTVIAAVEEDAGQTLALLSERSEGNALYATMLIRGAVVAAERGVAPFDYLLQSPTISGDLNRYYDHLYQRLSLGGKQVADILGVIDFAVTEEELRAIVGLLTGRILSKALNELAPLLIEVAGKGGMRIFHESFRRYIISRDPDPSGAMRQLLDPVVVWLEALGFYRSGLSFRYLLPCLARAGRLEDLFSLVSPSFVADAISNCHPRSEIERNLEFANSVAATHQLFPQMVRVAHLLRASHTCFEEHLNDSETYWEAHLALYGAAATAARLAPDGVPSLGRHSGLRLCSKVADQGGNPPWSAYLALPQVGFEPEYGSGRNTVGDTFAAMVHGVACVDGIPAARRRVEEAIREGNLPAPVLGSIAARWVGFDVEGLTEFLCGSDIAPVVVAELAVSAAETLHDHDPEQSSRYLNIATAVGQDADVLGRCARMGAKVSVDTQGLRPEAIDVSKTREHRAFEEPALTQWLHQTRLVAFVEPSRLDVVRATLSQPGWYWSWLIFCTYVFEAEALTLVDRPAASRLALQSFEELSRDLNPFKGEPRAMDLYSARGLIRESIQQALACLDPVDWPMAVEHLKSTSSPWPPPWA